MSKNIMYLLVLVSVLTGFLGSAFRFQLVEASATIYIRADGSVEGTTDISTVDNVTYTLTNNIYDEIAVQRDNIVVDGADYTVQGPLIGNGMDLSYRSNLTVKNMIIRNFWFGINFNYTSEVTLISNNIVSNKFGILLDFSSNNSISGNSVTENNADGIHVDDSSNNNSISGNNIMLNNWNGIVLSDSSNNNSISGNSIENNSWAGINIHNSSNNNIAGNSIMNNLNGIDVGGSYNTVSGNSVTASGGTGILSGSFNIISGNNITASNGTGIHLYDSSNEVSRNNIANNEIGIKLTYRSDNNTISGNNIINNDEGLWFEFASDNSIYNNRFINNTEQVSRNYSSANAWDDGVGKGNYWSDYEERYPDAKEINGSGIWDTPYIIDENNQDNYPIVPEFPSFLILPLFIIATLLAVLIYRRKQ